ncbi:hypothetical protein [Roseateles albus]|uniref:Porin n=1 Tax=Roseateles albus TaxID=2987525 RepID=A0ABT5KHS7_9BURK|nr:hypothetical protein [Roseateles albus]MDC8773502.1 hypothetical protein [Roseateles albus]
MPYVLACLADVANSADDSIRRTDAECALFRRHVWRAAALTLCLPLAAQAQEFSGSGFASLVAGRTFGDCVVGNLASKFNDGCTRYIADWGHAGVYDQDFSATPESRLGLQGSVKFNPQWSATAQVTARTLKDQHLNLEWLYLSYQIAPEWTLQVGRKRLPLYYYSDFQDVGYAYNTIRPSPDVYGWDVVNYNGVSLSYATEVGAWTLRTEVLGGSEKSKKNPYSSLYNEADKTVEWGGVGGASFEFSRDWFTGRLSYVRSKFKQTDRDSGTVDVYSNGPKQSFLGLALNADWGDWIVRSEFGRADRETLNYKANFFLATLGYRMGKFTLTAGASAYRESSYDEQAYAPVKLRSGLAALRYEVHKDAALKLQFDHVSDSSSAPGAGSSRVLSASYDLVF